MSQAFPLAVVWHLHVILLSPRYLIFFFFFTSTCQLPAAAAAVFTSCCFPSVVLCLLLDIGCFSDPSSQTYGSGNLKRVGVILQRGVLILLLACFPCWAVLINTQLILVAVRQSPEVARWNLSMTNPLHLTHKMSLTKYEMLYIWSCVSRSSCDFLLFCLFCL